MTIIEFYKGGRDAIDAYDVVIAGGNGYAYKVESEQLVNESVVRVLVSHRRDSSMDNTLLSMMQVVILYPMSTVVFYGFHE